MWFCTEQTSFGSCLSCLNSSNWHQKNEEAIFVWLVKVITNVPFKVLIIIIIIIGLFLSYTIILTLCEDFLNCDNFLYIMFKVVDCRNAPVVSCWGHTAASSLQSFGVSVLCASSLLRPSLVLFWTLCLSDVFNSPNLMLLHLRLKPQLWGNSAQKSWCNMSLLSQRQHIDWLWAWYETLPQAFHLHK